MKELPSVSAFPIDKKLNNYQEKFYGSQMRNTERKKVNVISKINDIFASNNHVYKSRVRIELNDDILERTIVGKTKSHLLTLTGDKIDIDEIIDIERI